MSLQHKLSQRIPVVYHGKAYMPMRWKRAKALVKKGKAKICKTKDNILYLKLKYEPSGDETQDVVYAVDPGSMFDGVTVMTTYCHNFNCELIHTTKIKDRMDNRRMYRRIRRSRLRHRPARFNNRTKCKIPPTIRSKIEFRIFILCELMKIYPINIVCVEDVRFNHYKYKHQGRSFSPIEVGKTYFYDTVKSLGLQLKLLEGYDTATLRRALFPGDPKCKNKATKSFYAHCIDSFTIGVLGLPLYYPDMIPNLSVHYIERLYMNRRELYRLKSLFKDKKYFVKHVPGGDKVPFKKYCKPRKLRVKDGNTRSNHGPWEYKYQTVLESFHQFRSRYGGTIIVGGSSWKKTDIGKPKRLVKGKYVEYLNRVVEIKTG